MTGRVWVDAPKCYQRAAPDDAMGRLHLTLLLGLISAAFREEQAGMLFCSIETASLRCFHTRFVIGNTRQQPFKAIPKMFDILR